RAWLASGGVPWSAGRGFAGGERLDDLHATQTGSREVVGHPPDGFECAHPPALANGVRTNGVRANGVRMDRLRLAISGRLVPSGEERIIVLPLSGGLDELLQCLLERVAFRRHPRHARI